MFCEIGKWEKYPDNRVTKKKKRLLFRLNYSSRYDNIFKTSLDNSLRQIDKLEKEGVKERGDGWRGLNFSSRVRSYYYHYCYSNSDIGAALSSATTCVHQSQRKSYF
ncbi:hypothetical protein T03_17746 [Trichinella britovi]|uniref:Uncharacterized protein n=1 Tax=Trichinella britovi TaxID=45882 RepID=A0A0V1D7S4_TRIBR|nr:hypothetical protein T03_17746 [Trichinella britovi]